MPRPARRRTPGRTPGSLGQVTTPSVMLVNDGMFAIADDAGVPVETADWSNGLAAPMDHGAWILTGIHTGRVRVRARALGQVPPADTATWEEIVEISVRSADGDLRIRSGYAITPDDLPVLSARGPGWYRIRVHARGRAANPDGVSDEPAEDYLITAWPQQQEPPGIIRTSTMIEEALRTRSRATPGETVSDPVQEPAPKPGSPNTREDSTAECARLLRHLGPDR